MIKPLVVLSALKLHEGPRRTPAGNFQHVLHLASALAKRNDTRLVILTDLDSYAPFAERIAEDNLVKLPIRGNSIWAADMAVFWALRKYRPQIYHRPAGQLPFWPIGCRAIAGIADLNFRWLPTPLLKRLYKELSYRWTVWRADRIICVSEFTRTDVIAQLKAVAGKTRVVYHGSTALPLDGEAKIQGLEGPYFLAFGHQTHKNAESVMMAFGSLKVHGISSRLAIIGDNDFVENMLKPLASRLGLDQSIVFLGAVSSRQLAWLYCNAVALSFPSRFEGFGLPVLEAMQAGCPVICSNVCSLPEVAGDAALVVAPDDVSALAQGMQRLLTEPELRECLSRAGKQRAAAFTWERAATQTAAIYHELISNQS